MHSYDKQHDNRNYITITIYIHIYKECSTGEKGDKPIATLKIPKSHFILIPHTYILMVNQSWYGTLIYSFKYFFI